VISGKKIEGHGRYCVDKNADPTPDRKVPLTPWRGDRGEALVLGVGSVILKKKIEENCGSRADKRH